jgi:hypothetical protein
VCGSEKQPLAYLLTFSTYGNHFHGDATGSVNRGHTAFDTPLVVPNPGRVRYEKEKLSHPAVTLNQRQQDLVLQSVRETCKHRQWPLWAVQVRTNHAHVVLQSPQPPEKCLITLKAYATRCLRKNFQEKEWSQVWTRHGSTRYL